MKRIQQRRTKGWRAPACFRSCARPHKFGNPIKVGHPVPERFLSDLSYHDTTFYRDGLVVQTAFEAALLFKRYVLPEWIESGELEELRQYEHLGGFCSLDSPCHVDAIIEALS